MRLKVNGGTVDPPTWDQIEEALKALDGDSNERDVRFPAHISGRTFRGTWKATQSKPMSVEVIAEMGWDNGMSGPGNYHRIEFSIYGGRRKSHAGPPRITKVFDAYYIISSLNRMPKTSPGAASAVGKP